MKSKRNTLKTGAALLLTLLLAFSLAACGQSEESAPAGSSAAAPPVASGNESAAPATIDYTVKVAQSPGLCQAPIQIAVEKGFFEAEGLKVENVNVEAAHVQEALGANQVDVAQGLISKYLQPIENGLGVKFVAGIHTGCIKILAGKDSGITSIADLRGKKIGVPGLADAATYLLERSLADEGIRFKQDEDPEVEILPFDKNDLGQALQNGAIDVIAVNDPQASQFETNFDLLVLVDSATDAKYKDEYCCAVVVTDALYESHPDAAAAFTRALLKASAWVAAHPEEAAAITLEHDYVAGEVDFNTHLLSTYNYIPSVQGGYDAVQKNVAELTAIGILAEGTDAKAFADASYVFFDGIPDSYTAAEAEASIGE